MTHSGLAHITWTGAREVVWGHAEVYCAAYAPAGGWRSAYWPSRLYVCPQCGQAWMRETWRHSFQYASDAGPPWVAVASPCRWHGGGFLLDHLHASLESCDAAILHRETKLYFDRYDHEHTDQHYPSLNNWRRPVERLDEPDLAWPEGLA